MTITSDSPTISTPQEAPDSLLAVLRKRRERQAATRTRVFELPGYRDLLGVRLRTVDERGVLNDSSVMLGEGEASEADAAALFDHRRLTIARACVEIVGRDSTSDAWTPLADRIGDGLGPVRFDQRLVEALGGVIKDGDGVVEAVKFVVSKPLPFLGLYGVFAAWCERDEPLDDDDVVGESSAAN